jgi:hypothetical protein
MTPPAAIPRAGAIVVIVASVALFALFTIANARVASADPSSPQEWTAPSAWLPAAGDVTFRGTASAGGNDFANRSLDVGYGLGGIASIELDADGDIHCATCSGTTPTPNYVSRATFRMGARQDQWFTGQPALVFGVQRTFSGSNGLQLSEGYLAASRVVSRFRLHAGVAAMSASATGRATMPATIRPFGAIEWTPPQYPKTTVVVDVMWQPQLEASTIDTQWLGGFGVRYQTFKWGAISLSVRERGTGATAEGLDKAAVIVRFDGTWSR